MIFVGVIERVGKAIAPTFLRAEADTNCGTFWAGGIVEIV